MPRTTSRLGRVDPWGPALATVGVVVFLVHGFDGILTRDLALYAYGGQQFAEGVPPFVSVLNRAGPLAHMVPGVATWVARLLGADSGADDLMAMRVLMMMLSVAAVWVVYLLARDAFGSSVAGVAAAASLLAFEGFVTYATGGPREKTTMMLLVALALWALVHRRWMLAGAAVALATLTWQPAFFAGAAAAGAAVLLVRGGRARLVSLARFAGGGLLVTAAFAGYYAAVGALEEFFNAFYLINATYTRQPGVLQFLSTEPTAVVDGFGWSWWLILAGLAAMVVLGARRLRGLDRDDPHHVAVVALGGGTVGSLLWSLMAFNGWADAVLVLPLAATGLGGMALSLSRAAPRRPARVGLAAYVVAVLVAAALSSWHTRDERLVAMRWVHEAVLEAVGPDAAVMSIGSPQPLVLGRLENPMYHQMFLGGLAEYVDDTWPGGLSGLADDIERERPTLITMDRPGRYGFVDPVVDRHYERLGTTYVMTWFADRSIGERKMQQLRDAVEVELPEDG